MRKLISVAVLVVFVAGCKKDGKNTSVVGKWNLKAVSVQFYYNNQLTFDSTLNADSSASTRSKYIQFNKDLTGTSNRPQVGYVYFNQQYGIGDFKYKLSGQNLTLTYPYITVLRQYRIDDDGVLQLSFETYADQDGFVDPTTNKKITTEYYKR